MKNKYIVLTGNKNEELSDHLFLANDDELRGALYTLEILAEPFKVLDLEAGIEVEGF